MANVCLSKTIDGDNVVFNFLDGTKITVNTEQFSDEIRHRAMMYGFSETLGNSYAGAAGSVKAAIAKFNDRLTTLKNGIWRAAGGGTGGILAEALYRASQEADQDYDLEACQEVVRSWDKKEKAIMRKKLAKQIAKIELERAESAPEGDFDVSAIFAQDDTDLDDE